MNRLRALALVALAITACASSYHRAEPGDFAVSVTDDVMRRQFAVTFVSKADRPLCISKESWPAEDGTFPLGWEGTVLSTSAGSLHPKAALTAYCPGGCGEVRIDAGQQLKASVAYSAFGDAEAIAADPQRSLAFPAYPYYCRR
ncbi:hypothetical protein LDO31_14665 [Luteimonas sp. XNQY3]|nr:hypothetical protein [Luteimonas sp. XNQY3]MCD9007459.1 hypothetical protein [Luteimonas sp. XNQY3]